MKNMKKRPSPSKDSSANVSTLKTHLGRYLKHVKSGHEVTVLDRQVPVAKLIPIATGSDPISVERPTVALSETIAQLKANIKVKPRLQKSILAYLQDDRGD